MIDVATEIQQVEQAMPDSGADQERGEVEDDSDDVEMKEEEVKQRLNIAHIQEIARVFLGYFVMHYWLKKYFHAVCFNLTKSNCMIKRLCPY